MIETTTIKPQPRQELFLATSADIAIYGGAAGGGKTWALLLEPLRHKNIKGFGAVIFRRSIPEITKEGGVWDEARHIYPLLDAAPNKNDHSYTFPGSEARVTFGHLQYDDTVDEWKSSQIPLIEFDQLETFTEHQFFYMLSRNRSVCGVRPYVRATCNPEPGWLAKFLDWWIGEDGYAITERSGIVRWMVRENDKTYWASTPDELKEQHPTSTPKTVTFILSTIFDNQILLTKDPGYLANLQALPYVDRERLLGDAKRGGNWKVKPSAGKVFNRSWFEIVDAIPAGMRFVRFWDLAATEKKMADFTAGVKMGYGNGIFVIVDCIAQQIDPAHTDNLMDNVASQDGKECAVRWEQEGGASGKRDTHNIATRMVGYDARGIPPQGDKLTRAKALAAQSLAGNVKLLRGAWNDEWLDHMHGQPELPHDDIMDASSGAFNELAELGATAEDVSDLGKVERFKSRWS